MREGLVVLGLAVFGLAAAGCTAPVIDCGGLATVAPHVQEPSGFWALKEEARVDWLAWIVDQPGDGEPREMERGRWVYPLADGHIVATRFPLPVTMKVVVHERWTSWDGSDGAEDLKGLGKLLDPKSDFRLHEGEDGPFDLRIVQEVAGIATTGSVRLLIVSGQDGFQQLDLAPWGRAPPEILDPYVLLDRAQDHLACASGVQSARNLVLREPLVWDEGILVADIHGDITLACGDSHLILKVDAVTGALLDTVSDGCPT